MSQISLKSITGITSITTPTGVDNQLTLHTNNTNQAFKLDHAGNLHFNNHVNTTGISTASNFKTGTSNLHSTGLNIFDLDVDGHTNLDNVSIAGVTTMTGNLSMGETLTVSGNNPNITFTDTNSNPDYKIYGSNGAFTILDSTNGVNRFAISSTGNISISNDLDVDGHTNLDNVNIAGVTTSTGNIYADNYFANSGLTLNNNGNPSVNITSTSTTGSSRIHFGDPDSGVVGKIYYVHNGDYMQFNTAYAERLRIDSSGRMGLGTNSPTSYDNEAKNLVVASADHTGITIASTGSSKRNNLYFADGTSGNAAYRGAITYDHNIDDLYVRTAGVERVRIDSSGRLLIGTTATDDRDGYNSALQIGGTSGDTASMSIGRYSANVSYPSFVFSKSRNATVGGHTRINTGDYLGGIQFQGDDGARFLVGASIVAQAASPVADYDMATDLVISTNYGTTSPSKSMTFDHQGRLTKPNTPFVMVTINSSSNRQTTGSKLIIPWDTIHGRGTSSNVGGHFNTSNHRFTAPIDGRYMFICSMNIRGDNICYHRVNGNEVSYAEYRMTELVWDHVDFSFVYDMNANDYYEMYSQLYNGSGHRWNGGNTANGGWDTLSIYLLG